MAKKSKKTESNLLSALLYIVIGVLFCIFKDSIINWILTVAGIVLIIKGIVQVVNKHTQSGVINLLFGALIIVFGWLFLEVALVIFGVVLIISAVSDFSKSRKKGMDLLRLAITIIIGVLLATNGFAAISWIFIVIGVIFIIQGILLLIPSFKK